MARSPARSPRHLPRSPGASRAAWRPSVVAAFAALATLAAASGCATSDGVSCRVGADCASGACRDGFCVSPGQGGGGAAQGGGGQGGGGAAQGGGGAAQGGGGQGGGGAAQGGGGASGVCTPNHDGVIERAEVPLAAGLDAKFLVAADASFDTAGEPSGGGTVWDLAGSFPGDHLVLAETQPMAGKWFASTFPTATYATRLADDSDLLGVFEVSGDALSLLGVVSPEDGLTKTELTYDPPVVVLSFPLEAGATWSTSSTVSGLAEGFFATYFEDYDSAVDAEGTLETPFAAFPVLRVRVDLTRTAGLVTTKRTFAFVTECFGTVGTVVSQDNELASEFSSASELRRLSP
jgi:hypothetical protein